MAEINHKIIAQDQIILPGEVQIPYFYGVPGGLGVAGSVKIYCQVGNEYGPEICLRTTGSKARVLIVRG